MFQKLTKLEEHSLLILSAVMIPLMILIVYWRDLTILVNEALHNEAVTHIVLVPVLASYIVYRKRDFVKATFALEKLRQRSRASFLNEVVGLALCLSAFLLYWYGSHTFHPLEYHLASLPLFLAGIVLILFNLKMLIVLIFPILFLLFLIPPPSVITYTAGALIANFNTQASYTLLKTFGLPVVLQSTYGPPTIAINTYSGVPMLFAVDLPCSGIYSLIAFVMFATFLSYIIKGSLIKKAGLFLLGFAILLALNIVRISTIVAIGYWFGEEIAMAIFHTATGWLLIFCGILLLLLIAEKLWHLQIFGGSNEAQSCSECDTSLKNHEPFCLNCGKFLKNLNLRISGRFWIKITALVVGLFLVTLSIQAPVFAFAKGLTFTDPNLQVTTEVFPEFEGYQLRFLYRDVNYERISRQDASLLYAYIPLNVSTPTVYVDIGIANSITNLHNWEVCWVTWQAAHGRPPLALVLNSRDVQIMENPPIIARYFVFQSPDNYTQVTLYWYERVLFNTGLTVEQKYVRINLIVLATDPTTYHEHQDELLTFAQSIASYWEPLKEQSLVSLGVSLLQFLLAASALFIIIAGMSQYLRQWKKKENNQKIFEKFAPPSEKLLFQIIKKVNEKTKATTKRIAHALEQTTGKSPESDELIHMLNHLQENGLVEIDIANLGDNPQLVWKT
ncbi:MAG: exosortase/archaeosortase family protein [Candidatus Bathyarchaeaceae archaeon]